MALDLSALSLEATARLENLPLDILLIVFSYLDTARSVASLGRTCRKLHSVVRADGWRIFVRSHFGTLSLPQDVADDDWMECSRRLTCHWRSWDRRAFSVASFVSPTRKQPRHNHNAQAHGHGQHGPRAQTIPPHIVVAANSRFEGRLEEETVAWGAGEDVVVRSRLLGHDAPSSESWLAMEGAARGFKSGKDDVTAISILDDEDAGSSLLVGRASGHLHLMSARQADFGRTIASFCPEVSAETSEEDDDDDAVIEQRDLQDFDINERRDTVAVVTKDNALLYSLSNIPPASTTDNDTSEISIQPSEALDIRNMEGSRQFRLLRTVSFMGNGDLVLGMTGSPEPLRYLTRTPTGLEIINAPKLRPSHRCSETYIYSDRDLQSVRGLLPISASSVAGGSGNVVLSSFDDGTIRLQDLRSPSAVDTIYQDHFEVMTPAGPLLSHGLERFVAGSARTSSLKVFDFRWTAAGYDYTAALPCSTTPLEPLPRPPTLVSPPTFSSAHACDHRHGLLCNRHALARTDFYRPNCNLYLPVINQYASPIYSLAKPSDLSANIYAGLAGQLVRVGLRDRGEGSGENLAERARAKRDRAGYSYHESAVSIIETGDGLALGDVSKSQRVPEIRKQSATPVMPRAMEGKYRLDTLLL